MLDLLQQGFGAVFSFNILILMFIGVAVGIVFGAVPGLSATMAVALCLPLTFTMGPQAVCRCWWRCSSAPPRAD